MKKYGVIQWKIDHVVVYTNHGSLIKHSETIKCETVIPKSIYQVDVSEMEQFKRI